MGSLLKKGFAYARSHPKYLIRQLRLRTLDVQMARKSTKGKMLSRVLLMLTGDCNLDCEMCNAPRAEGQLDVMLKQWRQNSMKLEDYRQLFADLKMLGTDVTLTGGEPLIHRRWMEIAAEAKLNGLKVDLQTNGVFLDRYVDALLNYVDVINVSVDGPPEIHDKIRGRKGSFQKIMENCQQIEQEKTRQKLKKPSIQIVPTITESNYHCLFETVECIHRFLPRSFIGIQHLMFVSPHGFARYKKEVNGADGARDFHFWLPSVGVPQVDVEVLVAQVQRIRRKYSDLVSFVPELRADEIRQWYGSPESLPSRFSRGCLSPWLELDVCPDGDVRICIDISLGNVKRESILEIFHGEKTCRLREKILSEGPYSICRACCNLYKY